MKLPPIWAEDPAAVKPDATKLRPPITAEIIITDPKMDRIITLLFFGPHER
jgi:hypothetical protein